MSAFYDLASLVLVPSGYKSQKIYAQKPLTTDGQLTFSRASTATRVNSAGLIETVSSNVPRLDYLNSSCPRLLLEPQRTNLLTYSEQFDNSSWNKNNVSVTANNAVSPDGYLNADLITADGSTNIHDIFKTFSGSTSNSVSVFVKRGTGRYINLVTNYESTGTDWVSVVFDLETLTSNVANQGNVSSSSVKIESYGNGWYRLISNTTCASAVTLYTFIGIVESANPTRSNGSRGRVPVSSASTFYLYGSQAETSASYATSYIPTTSAAVTRLADACSKSAAFTTSANWTIFAEFDYVNSKKVLDTTFTSSTGRFVGFYNWFGEFRVIYNTGGGAGAGRVVKNTNGKVKVILQNDGTDCFVFLNGVKLGGAVTGGPLPITGTLASISFSFYAGTLYDTAKELDKFLIFNQKLTDAQCVELTAL